jgi:threonine dehydrogenase-like Zn-dependent dehydrogenase
MDLAASRLQLLPTHPACIGVDSSVQQPAEAVSQYTYGRMADVVFEVTGNQNLISTELGLLRRQGRLVILSSPRGPSSVDFHDLVNVPSTTIIGAHQMSHPPHENPEDPWTRTRNLDLFFRHISENEFDCMPLISHRCSAISAGPKAYEMLYADRSSAMAVLLNW